jgi:SAM-dependent methyltransferase
MLDWQKLDIMIKEEVPHLLEKIQKVASKAHNETELRHGLQSLITGFAERIGLQLEERHGHRLIGYGQFDSLYNRLIVEWEPPRTLKRPSQLKHAIEQLHNYAEGIAKKERLKRLGCVAFDGENFVFARYWDGAWHAEEPVSLSDRSLRRFLKMLVSLQKRRALIADNLLDDFGIGSEALQRLTQSFYRALLRVKEKFGNHAAIKLFEQWERQFSQATGYREKAEQLVRSEEFRHLAEGMGISLSEAESHLPEVLFCLQTYYALLIKLLTWLTVSRYLGGRLGTPLALLKGISGEKLRERLRHMENGAIFREYDIVNFLEADFFGWYLKDGIFDLEVAESIAELIERLVEYDPATLPEAEPGYARDLLKVLYQRIMPRKIRHDLGEYYTPDWLALYLLRLVNSELFTGTPDEAAKRRVVEENLLRWRFLDPACGSGTFLVLIINRMKEVAQVLNIPESEILKAILNNVVGIDLSPVAVLTARANYLLALGELLEAPRDFPIHLPIYLSDSILTPHQKEQRTVTGGIPISTSVEKFIIPYEFIDEGKVDDLATALEEAVEHKIEENVLWEQLKEFLPETKCTAFVKDLIIELYHQLKQLHEKDMNALWARIIKNAFAPLFLKNFPFDYIVGNPPWVNWEHLPDEYRRETAYLWERYGLTAHKGADREQFELGKKKGDLSALMTLSVADSLLKPNGRLGFVITQSLLKTKAAAGFRKFCIPQPSGNPIYLRVLHVDDMVALKPFEDASNRTAVIVLEKGKQTTYPVPYTIWLKEKGAQLTYDSTLEEVMNATKRLCFEAEPVDQNDRTSPWLARPKDLRVIQKILGKSDYEAHEGVNTGGANAVYWVEILCECHGGLVKVRNITKGAKKKVDEVTKIIEPDLLYPLLRGRDVQRWKASPSAWILVPHTPETGWQAIPEEEMQRRYRRTWKYLNHFRQVLLDRAAYKLLRMGHPFYILKDINTYTFAPWKVVWRYVASDFIVAVAEPHNGRPVVPNEKLMLVACGGDQEAHYLCATLNSSPIRLAVRGFFVETQIAPHVIERLRIPRFDPKNPVHLRLAELSMQAHEAAKVSDGIRLREIETEIDLCAAKLWELGDDELRSIQQSLVVLDIISEPTEEE